MVDRRTVTYSSLQRVEARIGVLLAGTLAAIGLALDRSASVIDVAMALGYLRPLYLLLRAFKPLDYRVAPGTESVEESWPYYPKATTKAVFQSIGMSLESLQQGIVDKSNLTSRAINALFRFSAVMIVLRVAESLINTYQPMPRWLQPLIVPRANVMLLVAPSASAVPARIAAPVKPVQIVAPKHATTPRPAVTP